MHDTHRQSVHCSVSPAGLRLGELGPGCAIIPERNHIVPRGVATLNHSLLDPFKSALAQIAAHCDTYSVRLSTFKLALCEHVSGSLGMSMMWLLGVLGIVSSAASNASVAESRISSNRTAHSSAAGSTYWNTNPTSN